MMVLFWIVIPLIFEVNSDVYPSNGSTVISTSSESGLPPEKENSYRVHLHKKFDKSTKIILKFDADASVKLSDKSFARIKHEESNNTFIINFYKAHENVVLEVQGLVPGVVPHLKSIVINTVEYCKDPSVSADNSTNICRKLQAPRLGAPGSELRVDLAVEHSEVIPSPSTACGPQATCLNERCPKSTVCDGRIDCSATSDEKSYHQKRKCNPDQFMCANRKCVLKTWLCDSEDDCGDGSDEQNCVESTSDQCQRSEFACASNDQCVAKSFQCDGHCDCLDKSDEIGCAPVNVTTPPSPSNVKLNPGDTLTLICKAVGVPVPLISWCLNGDNVPENCKTTSINGVGTLTCHNMQMEHSGAYCCEAINNKGAVFANHDAIVYVNGTSGVFPGGYFNSEARSPSECIRCFCFGKSTQCQSADLFIINMPPLGEGGSRLVGVNQSPNGEVQVDKQRVLQYYFQPLKNGAMVTKLLAEFTAWSRTSAHPYLSLPETYNGNQLTSYGGHIKYRLSPHNPHKSIFDENIVDIIIKGTYQTLVYKDRKDNFHEHYVTARLTPGDWQKPTTKGLVLASREDIMMALDEVEIILLRADFNNAGVNITEFNMESAQSNNVGLGPASMVEECSCPEGYKGRSCENCADGFERKNSGPWNGTCTMIRTAIVNGRPRLKQKLTVSSTSPTVNEGKNIRVVCTGTDNIPVGSIDWVREDGTQFLSNVRSENGVLYIEYAVPENQGVYMCRVPPNYYMEPEIILLTVISLPSLQETTNITVSKDEITIPIGGSGTINCNPQGYPLPLIKWTKYQQAFGPGTSQRENTLVIDNAQDSDAGYYLCKGIVDGRTVVNQYVYVAIERREAPRVEIYPRGEMWVTLGTQYELHCMIEEGIPQPAVTWYRNDGRNFSERVQMLEQNNTLSFQTVEINDEGEYTCKVTNDAGSDSASAIIKVGSSPVITISPNVYIQVVRGDSVQVTCRADGYPEPEVSIRSSTDWYLRVAPSLRSATLTIGSVSDDGDYICTATSAAGATEEQFVIRVDRDYDAYPDGDDHFDQLPPENLSSMFAIEGQQIRITCNASEKFRVIWNREPYQDLQNNAVQNESELIIYNTSRNDSGLYGCTLVNLQTNEVKKSTQTMLEVLALPRITLRPPTQIVYSGQSPTVECIVEGDDIFNVTWKPSIAFSSRVEKRGSTLIFHEIEVEDAGKYECLAINTFGSTSAVAEVIVNGYEPPRVLINPQGENWVTLGIRFELHCIVEGGIPETTVTWYRNSGKYFSEHVQILQNNTLSFQTVEVNDEGEYTCTATNDAGSVSASAIIKVGFPPAITISPNEYIRANRGDRVQVTCRADGYPEPEVSIESSTGRYLWVPPSLRSATLTIGSVSDDGNYTCTATSAAGTTEEQFVIRVEGDDDAFPVTSAGLIRGCLYGGVALLWRKGLFPNLTVPDCGDNIQGYLDALISGYQDRAEAFRKKSSSQCGRRKITHTELIVNGSPSKAGDWPWHAALYRLERSQIKYTCGGTLISKYFVLTAAHCTSIRGEMLLPETLCVILGKFNLVGGDTGTQEKEVHKIIIHNKFEYRHLNNDIALLKLKTEAVYTDYVQPACLWYPKVHEKLPTNEIFGAVVGWGFDITDNLSHQLRQAKMPIVSDSTCIKSNPLFYASILNDNKFCAGYKNGTSACNGDSGGAFQVFVPDEAKDNSSKAAGAWYIKGIVSVTVARTDAPICDPEQYIVFTDVAKYLHWIENNTK